MLGVWRETQSLMIFMAAGSNLVHCISVRDPWAPKNLKNDFALSGKNINTAPLGQGNLQRQFDRQSNRKSAWTKQIQPRFADVGGF